MPVDDDLVLPFRVQDTHASGRLVRLGPAVDKILSRHDYPARVSDLLGQALLLVAMFGSAIKERSTSPNVSDQGRERFILQTQTNGPLNLLVADYHSQGQLRGYARFDRELVEEAGKKSTDFDILGTGHLAMTIDRGNDTDRYQGIVALEEDGLQGAANRYFAQSEQLPSSIMLAMARHFDGKRENWRGGALMVRKLTAIGGHEREGHGASDEETDADGWNRCLALAASTRADELLDPLLPAPDLLYRLFHEDGVRIFDGVSIMAGCSCSLTGVTQMLAGFSPQDQKDMLKEDGKVHITCEFCNRNYVLSPAGSEQTTT